MHQTRLLLYIITGLLLLLLPRLLPAEEGWRKAAEGADKKIVVYTRSVEGSPLKAFRGVTRVKATLGSLINLVKDVDAFPEWMYNAKSAKVLVQISDTERFVYTTQKSPWPVTDRDMVVYSKLEQDPDTRQVTVNLEARPHEYPEQEGYVRVPAMIGKWQYRFGAKKALFGGYRWRHISHAGLADRSNSGINTNAIIIGFSWLY